MVEIKFRVKLSRCANILLNAPNEYTEAKVSSVKLTGPQRKR